MNGRNYNLIQTYLQEISETDLVTREQEVELAARIKAGDAGARDHLVRANLRLVVKIAQDYANYGVPLADLISEGNIGLIKAVERFDPSKGGKLSTYGAWWIKQGIRRALANQGKTVRLPAHMVEKVYRMRKVSHQLSESLGRDPTQPELAGALGVPESSVSHWKTVSLSPTSLDAPVGEDGGSSFSELIGDSRARSPYEELEDAQLNEDLGIQMRALDDRERDILNRRYGLQGRSAQTLDDVGKVHRITRERVRQIQNSAIRKLRDRMDEAWNGSSEEPDVALAG